MAALRLVLLRRPGVPVRGGRVRHAQADRLGRGGPRGQPAVPPRDRHVRDPRCRGQHPVADRARRVGRLARRALPSIKGDERQQIKWVALALCLLVFSFVLSEVLLQLGVETDLVDAVVTGLAFIAIPVSIGIAVLRFRLYELDIVVKKALVAGALAVFVVTVYGGLVWAFGAFASGRESSASPVRDRTAARRGVPAGRPVRAPDRRPARVRAPGDPVRGADRVLGADRRRLRHRGRARPHGADPRRGHGRRARASGSSSAAGSSPRPHGRGWPCSASHSRSAATG
jgi:hypothetical protein